MAADKIKRRLSEDLRREIRLAGVSICSIARKMDKNHATVKNKLTGRQNLTIESIVELANAIGCDVEITIRRRE